MKAWKEPKDPNQPRDTISMDRIGRKQRKPLGFDMVFTPEEWKQFVADAKRSQKDAFFRNIE